MRRVVITGLGGITPLGNDVASTWEGILEGRNGIARITLYDTTDRKVKLAGEVKGFDPLDYLDKKAIRTMDRCTWFGAAAAKQAISDSGLEVEKEDPDRLGVIVSSGIGGLYTIESECLKGSEKGFDRVSPYFIPMAISNMTAGQIAIASGFQGMCSCVVTACAGGSNAIGEAFRYIRDGYGEVMLCGGTEASITRLGIGGFTSLRALSQSEDPDRASIPFDKERNGFVMGEGAGILILEEYEHAVKRGAKIYCEIAGYWANCDAHHITAPMENGEMAAKCMSLALNDAGISGDKIDYINAHGTSTALNDKGETKAVKTAFGAHANKLAMSSTKSMTGHLLGASGAVEAIITALSVKNDFIPATINYRVPDEECDLDIVPEKGRHQKVSYAMSNSLGFGGHNASLIFKKTEI